MFTREDLTRINNAREDGKLFTSVYLNVNPVTNPRGEYFVAFKNLTRKEFDKLNAAEQKLVKEDLKRIETYIKNGKRDFKKALAIISSHAGDIWEVYHLSVPVKNIVVIDKTPYLKPLANILEQYHSYAVALVDREHARLFAIHLGEIYEYNELFTPDVPRKHKKGGWYGRDENRFRRHIEVHVYFHLRDVVKHLEEILKTGGVNHLILGGSEESMNLFEKMLPQPIAAKIAGRFTADMHAGNDEILEKSMDIIKGMEKSTEEKLVDELVTRANKNGSAALGIDDVLSQLQSGNIHHLIYIEGFNASGFKCPSCGFLTIQDLKTCPYCTTDLEKIEHLIDYTVQKIIDQGDRVTVISENNKLREAGGIGALLRY